MVSEEILERLELLDQKFKARGQDTKAYLEGLLHSEFLSYWDYVHLDTLLSLQTPRTTYPDEKIFIVYHQITELYFNLVLHELDQISIKEKPNTEFLFERVKRVNNYFKALISSYEIMVDGMDKAEFLKFRMALLPASGFQSVQYRKIEISCTPLHNLANHKTRATLDETLSIEKLFEHLYWHEGATELKTGKKTLTLKMFEDKYRKELISLANEKKENNIHKIVSQIEVNKDLRNELRIMDQNINVFWPLSHYKSAVRYLKQEEGDIEATGGTNWQKFLPPRFQKICFFPELWSDREKEEWGKSWVEQAF